MCNGRGNVNDYLEPAATILGGPDLYVDKGSTINLTCTIRFGPEPPGYIFWYHENKVSFSDTNKTPTNMKMLRNAPKTDFIEVICFWCLLILIHILWAMCVPYSQTSGSHKKIFSFRLCSLVVLFLTIYTIFFFRWLSCELVISSNTAY